jgi:hypothetical protein
VAPDDSDFSLKRLQQTLERKHAMFEELKEEYYNTKAAFYLDIRVPSAFLAGGAALIRARRIVPILLLLLAGAIIAAAGTGAGLGIMNTMEISALKGQLENREGKQFVIEQIQDGKNRINHLEADVQAINFTTNWLVENMKQVVSSQAHDAVTSVLDDFLHLLRKEVERLGQGLTSLLHRQLSPSLINATLLHQALIRLKHSAEEKGFDLPSDLVTFVYQLPVSFVADRDGIIVAFVHVPLLRRDQLMRTYELINLPIGIPNSIHNVAVAPEADQIAVNSDEDGFVLLTSSMLQGCIKLGVLYLCPNLNYEYKRFETSCIGALFKHRSDLVTKICPTEVVPPAVKIVQVSQLAFYVFHPTDMELGLTCPTKKSALHFRGARLVELEPGCRGFGRDYEINAYAAISANFTTHSTATTWKIGQLTREIPVSILEALVPEPPQKPILFEDIVTKYWEKENKEHAFPWHFSIFGGLLSTTTLLVIAGVIVFCLRHQIADCLSPSTARQPHRVTIHSPYHDREGDAGWTEENENAPSRFNTRTRSLANGLNSMRSWAGSMTSVLSEGTRNIYGRLRRQIHELRDALRTQQNEEIRERRNDLNLERARPIIKDRPRPAPRPIGAGKGNFRPRANSTDTTPGGATVRDLPGYQQHYPVEPTAPAQSAASFPEETDQFIQD